MLSISQATIEIQAFGGVIDPFGVDNFRMAPVNQAMPTLSEWGIILLTLLLGSLALRYMRKQSHRGSKEKLRAAG